jgi:hypothetical protein
MSITVVTQAASTSLTTLSRVQGELGLSTGTDTDMLLDMIGRASSAICREVRRPFGLETVTETLDGSGSRTLGLARTPVVEVTEVTEDGTTLDTTEYEIEDGEAGALFRANGWSRSAGLRMWGVEAFSSGYILPGFQDRRYSVTYTAGYVLPGDANPFLLDGTLDPQPLPGAVEQACLETVRAWYLGSKAAITSVASGGTGAVSGVQIGSIKVSYGASAFEASSGSAVMSSSLPPSALGLLRNYYGSPV